MITLTEWDESFRTYGPYTTMLNDFAFEHYHVFRAKAHMLTGFNPPRQLSAVVNTLRWSRLTKSGVSVEKLFCRKLAENSLR